MADPEVAGEPITGAGATSASLSSLTLGEDVEVTDMPQEMRQAIAAELHHIHDKVAFLETLYDQGRSQEALTLCCIYVEGLAQRIYGQQSNRGSKELFVKVLLEHGGEELLCLVDPRTLVKSLKGVHTSCKGSTLLELAQSIEEKYCASPTEVHTIDNFLGRAREDLPAAQVTLLSDHAWRGTIAALVYGEIRSSWAHWQPQASTSLLLFDTVFKGKPVELVSFEIIYAALWKIGGYWREQVVNGMPWREQDSE